MADTWFSYRITPIDLLWGHLTKISKAIRIASIESEKEEEHDHTDFLCCKFASACLAAGRAGWGGCSVSGPCVFWIPVEGSFEPAFVFKEWDNGTTYVVSPVQLPHLDKLVI